MSVDVPMVVIHVPHAATAIPADLRGQFALSDEELARELLLMTDWSVDELFALPADIATTVRFGVSRLVVDPERAADDAREPLAALGMGAVYTATHQGPGGPRLRRELTAAERRRLIERFHEPHRERLVAAVRAAIDANGRCLLITARSFAADPLPCELDQDQRRPAVCLGTDPAHTPPWLRERAMALFAEEFEPVAFDRPLAGAPVPDPWRETGDERVAALTVAVDRCLYMNEAAGEKEPYFGEFATRLSRALLRLVEAAEEEPRRAAGRSPAAAPALSPGERQVISKLDDGYAWQVMLKQVYGWNVPNHRPWFNETVGGTAGSLETVHALAAEMERLGLEPGAADGTYVEEFPVDGWEDLGSSATVVSPSPWTISPSHQAYKGAGTGPQGITAPLVDVGYGRWADFERAGDVSGRIVLLHRADPMFYGEPSLAEARARGAVGALMDYPDTAPGILKQDQIAAFIPTLYIRPAEWGRLAGELAAGTELVVKLVVDNRVGHYPTAHNVIGQITGAVHPDEFVYLGCHFDHWLTSAADDGAGVGSLFAIAKALKAMQAEGWRPRRTLVFAAFDSEELGGPPDTWYDWCLGSFSHMVGRLPGGSDPEYGDTCRVWDDGDLLPALRGERAGKIVAMLNMDVIGVKDATVYVESTPDVTAMLRRCAEDAGLVDVAETQVYWPPSSYDEWQFFMKGVPCMQIAFWGPAYDGLYHTSGDVPDVLDPAAIHANLAFNGLALLRFDRAGVIGYDLDEDLTVARLGIDAIREADGAVFGAGHADLSALAAGMDAYAAALRAKAGVLSQAGASEAEAARVNAIQLRAARELLPHLFAWDTRVIPGWSGLFVFDSYADDLKALNEAIGALEAGDAAGAAGHLEDVTTMAWGRFVGRAAYDAVLAHIAANPHLLWGRGYVPRLTDVHTEYASLTGRPDGGLTAAEVLTGLTAKRDAVYGFVTAAADRAGAAFSAAAAALREL